MIKKLTACVLLVVMMASSVAFAATPAGHWFEGSVQQVAEFYPRVADEDFDPESTVTYAKFADMATNATGRAIAYPTDKTDVAILRFEALTIICERLNLKYDLTEEEEITTALAIADFNDMPQEYKQTALMSVKNGLLKGDENGMLNLDQQATYAEILTIFLRAKNR